MVSLFRKIVLAVALMFVTAIANVFADHFDADSSKFLNSQKQSIISIYRSLGETDVSFNAFSSAYSGYLQFSTNNILKKPHMLTIIDFNKSSIEDRLFIIDLKKRKVIHQSLVAHGKNSGWDIPTSFSNAINSNKSSLGFFVTGETYYGKHGRSLKLDGLEKGINDNARKRHIVIHQADYVSHDIVNKLGRLGRSFGCPSLPAEDYSEIIDLLKERSLIFIYSNQTDYFIKSEYL